MNAPWVTVAVPSSVVCVPVALVASSLSSTILVDGAATHAVVVSRGTCFHVSLVVCIFMLNNLTAGAKNSSGLLSFVT